MDKVRKLPVVADGINLERGKLKSTCMAEETRRPFELSATKASVQSEIVHSDVSGPKEMHAIFANANESMA